MKKHIALLSAAMLLVVAIASFTVPALAYDAVDGTEWISGVAIQADGSVLVSIDDSFTSGNGVGGYRISVFEGDPELTAENDAGFRTIFNGTGAFWTNPSGAGSTQTVTGDFKEGQKYYIGLAGLAADWTWSPDLYEFIYDTEGADGDTVAAKGGTTFELALLDSFNTVDSSYMSAWDPYGEATSTVNKSGGVDNNKSLFITTGAAAINSASYNPTNGSGWAGFLNNRGTALTEQTTALAFRVRTDEAVSFDIEHARWNGGTTVGTFITLTGDEAITLVDSATGLVTEAEMRRSAWSRNLIILPAGFDGYVILPVSRLTSSNAEDAVGDWNQGSAAGYIHFWTMGFFVERLSGSASTLEIMDCYTVNSALPTFNTKDTNWTVTFDDQNGNTEVVAKNEDNTVNFPEFTPADGTYLVQWNTMANGTGDAVTPSTVFAAGTDETVYAIVASEVEYTCVVNGVSQSISSVNGVLSLPEAPEAPEGYLFKEWNTAEDGTGDTVTADNLDAGMTIYAIFEEKPQDTADLSVIAYAAAALAAAGGLVTLKRKKH